MSDLQDTCQEALPGFEWSTVIHPQDDDEWAKGVGTLQGSHATLWVHFSKGRFKMEATRWPVTAIFEGMGEHHFLRFLSYLDVDLLKATMSFQLPMHIPDPSKPSGNTPLYDHMRVTTSGLLLDTDIMKATFTGQWPALFNQTCRFLLSYGIGNPLC